MFALGQMGAKATDATPRLVSLLGHSDRATRERSAYTLGLLGGGAAAAVPTLV
jgi:HEAT repeat protein